MLLRGLLICLCVALVERTDGQCLLGELVAEDAGADDLFGRRVAVDGAFVLIGAHRHDPAGTGGAAFLFTGAGPDWTAEATLVGGPLAYRGLGRSVALLDGVAFAGSVGDAVVLVFAQPGVGDWQLQQALPSPDSQDLDFFGWSAACDGQTLVVGAPEDSNANGGDAGSAHVFERGHDAVWVRTAKLIASDGSAGDAFGTSLGVKGDVMVVGAPENDVPAFASGAAYVFERDPNGTWLETARLLPDTRHGLQLFGESVATDAGVILVGAYGDDAVAPTGGAAYVFERDVQQTWVQTQRLVASDGGNSYFFGISVAIDGDLAIVGAENADTFAENRGAAYVFHRQVDGTWIEIAKLFAPDGRYQDEFGRSVALDGNIAVVGAPYRNLVRPDGSRERDAGAAYVFAVGPDLDGDGIMDACICPGDVNGDFAVDIQDLVPVLFNFGNPVGPPDDTNPACLTWPTRCLGDLDRDGDVDISDLGIVMSHWGEVCP